MYREKEVIERAKANDQIAFNTLFNKYWDPIYSFLISRTSDANKAEELPGASGVILDDVIAGIYSLIIVFISKYFLQL